MASTSIELPASMVRVIDERYPNLSSAPETMPLNYNMSALAKFAVPAELQYKRIFYVDVRVWLYFNPRYPSDNFYNSVSFRLYGLGKTFSSNVTYNTKPYVKTATKKENTTHYTSAFSGYRIFGDTFSDFRSVLDYGVEINADARYPDDGHISTSPTTNPITAEISYYDDEEPSPTISVSPAYGSYVPKGKANTFRWSLVNPSSILGKYSVLHSRFYWRNASDANYTVVDCGAATSYTVPAGTFIEDTVYWGVEVDTQNNKTVRNINNRLSTQEPLGVATPESPINTVEDGSAPIRFAWSYANSSGMDSTASDLQVSSDGATWTDLPQVTGSSTEYTAPADSLPGGTVYWRVRSYNQDGAAGDWSPSVSFVNVAAPAAPIVSSDGAPFATITWQAVGQQAYELTVDGRSYGIAFGSGKTYTLSEPLADGEHTAAVRVQGAFGLWSQPGETAFSVTNSGGRTVLLQGGFGEDAVLSWTEQEAGADVPASALSYTVYRDDARIAETEEQQYTDRLSLGLHTYRVIGRLSDGNAAYSNEVSGTVETACLMIAEMDGGEWLRLRLSDQGMQEHGYNFSRTQSLRHIAGAAYPVLEQAPYYDQTGSFDVAFYSRDEARRFEALFGRVVVLKSPQGSVIIGPLSSMDKRENHFYTAYTFTIQRIHWEGADGQDD